MGIDERGRKACIGAGGIATGEREDLSWADLLLGRDAQGGRKPRRCRSDDYVPAPVPTGE